MGEVNFEIVQEKLAALQQYYQELKDYKILHLMNTAG